MRIALCLLVLMTIFSAYNPYKLTPKFAAARDRKKSELRSSIDDVILKNILNDISSIKEDEKAIHSTATPALFPKNPAPLISKRSNIEGQVSTDDEDDGALVVVDVSGPKRDENADKKSSINDKNSEIYDGKGYSIVLNNNGDASEEKVGQKDEIYYQMQAAYRDMEKEFSGIVREPRDPKKVRVIVITPKVENAYESRDETAVEATPIHEIVNNVENAVSRDKLPDILSNKSVDNIVSIDQRRENSTANARLYAATSKSDLEMDIDKLRHVKEKLKLLNEDDDKVSDALADDNAHRSSAHVKEDKTSSETMRYRVQSDSDEIPKVDASLTTEAERQRNTLNSFQKLTNSDDVVKDATNQIYNSENSRIKNETEMFITRTIENPRLLRMHMNMIKVHQNNAHAREIDNSLRKNITENVFYEPTLTTTRKFIEKTSGNDILYLSKAHESKDESKVSNDIISKDKLQLEKEITDQRATTKLPVTTTTSTTSVKQSLHESRDQENSESSDNRKHEIAKYVQKLLQEDEKNKRNMTKLLKASEKINKTIGEKNEVGPQTTASMLKTIIKMKNVDTSKIENEGSEKLSSEETINRLNLQSVHGEKLKENHVIPVSKNPHEISSLPKTSDNSISHEIKTLDSGKTNLNPEKEEDKVPTTREFQQHHETTPKTVRTINKRKAEAIIEFLNKDPLESWKYEFSTLRSLDLNSTILRSGLVNAGNIERLKGVMKRALEGKDITLSVVGGSISAGGGLYKDKGNIDGLYYKGVVDWWNKMISPLTGSQMKINNIAIGSIGTDYFSYCIKNHISEKANIVLWELSANDFNRYKMQPTKGARPLERLTRMILELPTRPALLYVNFFKGIDYKASRESCPNFEDQGEDIIAHYYKIPSLSWRSMVCGGLVRQEEGFKIESLFSQDQYHPSLRGHAQMSLLLLLHLRHVMRAVLQSAIAHDGYIEDFEDLYTLPEPLFLGPKSPEPLCWTLITADMSEQITNTLSVHVGEDDGFKLEYATNFPIRFDKVICWKAEKPNSQVTLQFYIPENYGSTGLKRLRSEVAVTTHTRWGGSATLWIDDIKEKAVTIKEGRPNDPGKRTQVDSIANDVPAGSHTLNIKAREKGFCLSAIMIDGS